MPKLEQLKHIEGLGHICGIDAVFTGGGCLPTCHGCAIERSITMPLKALSFSRPWGSLVALNLKPIENRRWSTQFRGRVYIHSAKSVDGRAFEYAKNILTQQDYDYWSSTLGTRDVPSAIIGEVDIID